MINRLSPALKGLITAALMIAATLLIDNMGRGLDPRLQYLVFLVYGLGIIWTLLSVRGSFGQMFNGGFRCFVVVTIIMVIFTYVYVRAHPELAEQEALNTIEYYQKQGDKTPDQLEEMGKKAKKQYATAVVSFSIFRYLIIGALITAASAAVLNRRN